MAGDGAAEDSPATPMKEETSDGFSESSFLCCICLDLLYKPVVLACGHISCFWCIYNAMHILGTSHCAICRRPYNHFPSICQLLHHLLLKIAPVTYKRRKKEVLEEERSHGIFSPEFVDNLISAKVYSDHNSATLEGNENSAESLKGNINITSEESSLVENGIDGEISKNVSMDMVLCSQCKELLFRPAVLNCGHVYCKSCLSGIASRPLKCQVCQNLHPGEFPNVCVDLEHFLEEEFPREYAFRREKVQIEEIHRQPEDPTSNLLPTENQNAQSSSHATDNHFLFLPNAHFGIGCDSCGMYPLIGKRYRCKDCKEVVGFDLCEACYGTSSKLPGRFNQQHSPDHEFEVIDDLNVAVRLGLVRFVTREEDSYQDPSEA